LAERKNPAVDTNMKDLIKEVVGIPLNERAEVLMQYEIRKK
jgi:hypothetical protein